MTKEEKAYFDCIKKSSKAVKNKEYGKALDYLEMASRSVGELRKTHYEKQILKEAARIVKESGIDVSSHWF